MEYVKDVVPAARHRGQSLDILASPAQSSRMGREIKLDGGEISVLKALGLSGTQVQGRILLERVEEMEPAEFLETLSGLESLGYVLASKVNVRTIEDVERSFFRVNPSYSRDLKDALNPSASRDDRRGRRDRRS
jgi:hypothetical protein